MTISNSNIITSNFNNDISEIFNTANNLETSFEIVQLTNNERFETFLNIDGDYVAWQKSASANGSPSEILLYDGNQTINLDTLNAISPQYPDLDNGKVVWQGTLPNTNDSEIFFYDGTQTLQLTNNNNLSEIFPKISGNNIVWEEDNTDEIFFYNGTQTIRLTNNAVNDSFPQIDGNNVVWESFDGNDDEIFFYDGTQTIRLTNNTTDDIAPKIDGNNVVWSGFDGNDNEIFFYDGNQTIQLTNNNTDDSFPEISGNNVVWTGFDGNDDEIFFYNGTETIQITDNTIDDNNVKISGDRIAWLGFDGNDTEVFLATRNNPPTVTNPISDVTVNQNSNNINIDLSDVFNDADGDAISLEVASNTNSGLVTSVLNGTDLNLDLQNDQSGTANITIRATANGQSVDDTFSVIVNPINDNNGFDIQYYRFQNTDVPGTYIFVDEVERQNILVNFQSFEEEGAAFKVRLTPGEDLIAVNRYQSTKTPGTYLFSTAEDFQQDTLINQDDFYLEGRAFYAYGANSGNGTDFYRFENSDRPGTYLFPGPSERSNILVNFTSFEDQGAVWAVET